MQLAGEQAETTESRSQHYELSQNRFIEMNRPESEQQASPGPCDNGSYGKLMLSQSFLPRIQHAVCKPLPDDSGSAVVAVFTAPLSASQSAQSKQNADLDLHLFQIDYWGDIEASAVFPAVASNDAYELTDVQIDTAPYLLASGKRAFAIRSFNSNSTCSSCNSTQARLQGHPLKTPRTPTCKTPRTPTWHQRLQGHQTPRTPTQDSKDTHQASGLPGPAECKT